ncbi:hypothetical protein [Hoylesella loescheii]
MLSAFRTKNINPQNIWHKWVGIMVWNSCRSIDILLFPEIWRKLY